MKADTLFAWIGEVEDQKVISAGRKVTASPKSLFIKRMAMAACFSAVMLITCFFLLTSFQNSKAEIPGPSLSLTGGAADNAYVFADDLRFPKDETALLYTLDIADPAEIQKQIESILEIGDLNTYFFSGEQTESLYYIEEKNATVSISAQNGFWDITLEDPTQLIIPNHLPSDAEAVNIAKAFIEENHLFEGELGEPVISHSYYGNDQTTEIIVTFYPPVGEYEVFGLYRITIVLGDEGKIQKVFKQASPVKSHETVTLKDQEQVMEDVLHQKDMSLNASGTITKGVITDCTLGYYVDGIPVEGKNYMYPVYILQGEDQSAESGEENSFTIIVDAVKR